jgi:hypothetical protein|tara:strand:+ start:375 stop:563 length:189 start_codon:yes stop_codon:yes gene_type:complete
VGKAGKNIKKPEKKSSLLIAKPAILLIITENVKYLFFKRSSCSFQKSVKMKCLLDGLSIFLS